MNTPIRRLGRVSSIFLKSKHGTTYALPYGVDLPKRTCKRYGVTLKVMVRKNLGFQLVTVLLK